MANGGRPITVLNVGGYVCVDFAKKFLKKSKTARKVAQAILNEGAVQTHVGASDEVLRLSTDFQNEQAAARFIKERGGDFLKPALAVA